MIVRGSSMPLRLSGSTASLKAKRCLVRNSRLSVIQQFCCGRLFEQSDNAHMTKLLLYPAEISNLHLDIFFQAISLPLILEHRTTTCATSSMTGQGFSLIIWPSPIHLRCTMSPSYLISFPLSLRLHPNCGNNCGL
jgi:hypothetical protein